MIKTPCRTDLCCDLLAALFSLLSAKTKQSAGLISVCFCAMNLQAGFDDLVRFMSSGPCQVLLLSRVEGSSTVVQAWRDFIGPPDVEEARREKPERSIISYDIESIVVNVFITATFCSVTQADGRKEKSSEINSTFSPAFVRHAQVLCLPLVEHQPSDHLLSPPPSLLSLSPPPPLSPLPAACGRSTARGPRSTACTAAGTERRPAGSSPSSSPPSAGRPPRGRSRLLRKSVWRGHWR